MTVLTYNKADEFLSKVEHFLMKNEALNNLPLGISYRLANEGNHYQGEPFLGYKQRNDGEIHYALMRTPPHNWILAVEQDLSYEDVESFLTYIDENHLPFPGLIGSKQSVERIAERWKEKTGSPYQIKMEQKVFRLDEVEDIPISNGDLQIAQPEHQEIATKWLNLFGEEAGEPTLSESPEDTIKRMIQNQSLRLWVVDGEPVSMANATRPTKNGITLGPVYTPNEHKRKGYASSLVAKLSQSLLNEGYSFTSLYTDLNNPTSNKIYQRIGYKSIGDSIVVQFEERG
ncbi:GNAT family N-acetyltransferase [Pontibacillus marinus]|uniref:N-acetyltransferase domain-containing protein n=1 Tax=Pontibacillus marinus BH030004 = DSM 16465 TaxID=1385511 RepID=A0A0A5HKG5_9BACI|nr:GNAT family N-acetyltransferase [Pontibacillus marinus]KGX84122.1 hypothetical protein N783_19050 [Pontibacillus marinus BH030004 = DSM 16465]